MYMYPSLVGRVPVMAHLLMLGQSGRRTDEIVAIAAVAGRSRRFQISLH